MKKYASGNYPPGFIPSYLDLLAGAYMPVEPVLQKYLASLPEDQVHSRETWNILNRYVIDMNSSSFDFLMKNRGDLAKAFSKDSVYGKITSVISASLLKQARDLHSSDSSYNAAKEKVRASGYEEADKAIFNSDLSVYQYKGEKEKFLALAYEKTDKFYNNDYQMLNTIAWNVQEMTNDKKYLDKAAAWAKRSMSLKNAAFNNDTYAIIQLRLGNKDEAIRYEKNAIELARKNKESTKEYDETLKRMMQPEP
jgi:hypothetical protein